MRQLQSLKRKLTILFYLIALMTVGIGIIAVSLSQSLKLQVDAMVANDLAEVRLAMSQVRLAEQLQTTVAKLENVVDDKERSTLLRELSAQWQQLLSGTQKLGSFHHSDDQTSALGEQAMMQQQMLSTLARLDELSSQALLSRLQVANLIQNLNDMQAGFVKEYRDYLGTLDEQARDAMAKGNIPALNTLLADHRINSEFLHLGERLFATLLRTTEHMPSMEINTLQRQSLRLLREMEPLVTQLNDKESANNWLAQLKHQMVGTDNLFELSRNQQKRRAVAGTHFDEHASMARLSADFFQEEFRHRDEDIRNAGLDLKRDAMAFLVLIVVAGIVYCGLIWLTNWHFIAKGIINPVIATRNAMNDIVNEKLDTVLPKADNLELQQMVSSLETLKSYAAQVKAISEIDGLTGIHNRRYFDLKLDAALARHRREHVHLGLIMFDLDYFKQFNDTYGHLAGDQCLKDVVNRIKQLLPNGSETFARYGGEEFVLLLQDYDWRALRHIAEEIRESVANLAIPHRGAPEGIATLSMGIAHLPQDQQVTAQELIATGDTALYRAKRRGKNCCEFMVVSSGYEPKPGDPLI